MVLRSIERRAQQLAFSCMLFATPFAHPIPSWLDPQYDVSPKTFPLLSCPLHITFHVTITMGPDTVAPASQPRKVLDRRDKNENEAE